MIDFDDAWKEALDGLLSPVLQLLFAPAWGDIDWKHDYESLEQELRQLASQGEAGLRRCDKLVKVVLKGEGDTAYLHVEGQNKPERGFTRRVYVYNYRAEDRFGQPVVSLVILGDDRPNWRPRRYVFKRWGCRKVFRFAVVKLLDYRGREAELEAGANPAGLVVGHLMVLATRGRAAERLEGKVRLLLNLARREMDMEDRRRWYRVLDRLISLPAELEAEAARRVREFEEGEKMERLTNFERIGLERGLERGEKLGLEKGLEKGEKLGLEKGEKLGLEKGQKQGAEEGLRLGLAVSLPALFGEAAAPLVESLEKADLTALKRVAAGVQGRKGLDELQALVTAPGDGGTSS